MFRDSLHYTTLLHQFDDAVAAVWPEYLGETKCRAISHNPKDLERLCLAAYRLMKHIRAYLKKRKLAYEEGHVFPNLYEALPAAVLATTVKEKNINLCIEADKLEQVSRAAYHWLKTYKKLGRLPLMKDLARHKPKPTSRMAHCMVCKTEPATDDSGMLCSECSGEVLSQDRRGKCGLCKMPCKLGEPLCDLCAEGYGAGSHYPFDDDYPLPHQTWRESPHRGQGDMMFMGERWNKPR